MMMSPKEIVLELESTRVHLGLNKSDVCKKAKIKNSAYSRIMWLGQRGSPIFVPSLNKVRKALNLPPVVSTTIHYETKNSNAA